MGILTQISYISMKFTWFLLLLKFCQAIVAPNSYDSCISCAAVSSSDCVCVCVCMCRRYAKINSLELKSFRNKPHLLFQNIRLVSKEPTEVLYTKNRLRTFVWSWFLEQNWYTSKKQEKQIQFNGIFIKCQFQLQNRNFVYGVILSMGGGLYSWRLKLTCLV